MGKTPFFSAGAASDIGFTNVRDLDNDHMRAARENCNALWDIYEPYADAEFLTEIKSNFDARYWEMFLTVFFIKEGYKVSCPKPGPDVGIEFNGIRIWFEATCPTRGDRAAADHVPALESVAIGGPAVMGTVPNEKIILRYLNSISEKRRQYRSWLKNRIVSPKDAFVVAVNPRRIGTHEIADSDPPRILQAAFQIGAPYITIDSNLERTGSGYLFRDAIKKSSGAEVLTGVFQQDLKLSGLLCSRGDVANQRGPMGADFELVPNLRAKVPLPKQFRLRGTFFRIEHRQDSVMATRETVKRSTVSNSFAARLWRFLF
jgi:hypothetical protein